MSFEPEIDPDLIDMPDDWNEDALDEDELDDLKSLDDGEYTNDDESDWEDS